MTASLSKALRLTAVLSSISSPTLAAADKGATVDVVHFWVSISESAALDVFRQAWTRQGNGWVDLPVENQAKLLNTISDRIGNGYPPSVMQWHANESARELEDMGIVRDIGPLARADHWRDVLPLFVLESISYGDSVYLAPTNIHTQNWLWTSQAIFDELHLKTPETWDEIFTAAERIKTSGRVPFAIGGGAWEVALLFNTIMEHSMGREAYFGISRADPDAVLDPNMLEALELLRRVSLYTQSPEQRRERSWADATRMLGRGEAGMQIMGDWAKGELVSLGYRAGQDFGCNLMPDTSIIDFTVVDAFAFPLTVLEGSVEAQHAFARMLLDPDNQVAFSRIKGSVPARTDVDPQGLDLCGQLGLKQLKKVQRERRQSLGMPAHMIQGWNNILAEFFNDKTMSAETARERLFTLLKQG